MQILKTHDLEEAAKFADRCLTDGHEGLDLLLNLSSFIQTGELAMYDNKAVEDANIAVIWKAKHLGGTIVSFAGDFNLCLITWGDRYPTFGIDCINIVAEMLSDRGVTTELDNNDLIANGKKVASWAKATLISGYVQTVAHFSINVDVDLVKQICVKPMLKVPGSLGIYGIDAEMICEKVLDLLKVEERN